MTDTKLANFLPSQYAVSFKLTLVTLANLSQFLVIYLPNVIQTGYVFQSKLFISFMTETVNVQFMVGLDCLITRYLCEMMWLTLVS